jgi:hypothetical protein
VGLNFYSYPGRYIVLELRSKKSKIKQEKGSYSRYTSQNITFLLTREKEGHLSEISKIIARVVMISRLFVYP